MKKLIITMMLIMLATGVNALTIQQIFYDAEGSDTGKEFLELYNPSNTSKETFGFLLYTSTGDEEWELVWNGTENTKTILPESSLYIGENSSFDIVKDLNLQNSKGAVKLNEEIVGYGESLVFEGSPASLISDGYSLMRISDTNNNSDDFVQTEPLINNNEQDEVIIQILNGAPVLDNLTAIAEDDVVMLTFQADDINGKEDIEKIEYFFDDTIQITEDFIIDDNISRMNLSYDNQDNVSIRAIDSNNGLSNWISGDIINSPFTINSITGDSALPGDTASINLDVKANKDINFNVLMRELKGKKNISINSHMSKSIIKGDSELINLDIDIPEDIPAGDYKGFIEVSAVIE